MTSSTGCHRTVGTAGSTALIGAARTPIHEDEPIDHVATVEIH